MSFRKKYFSVVLASFTLIIFVYQKREAVVNTLSIFAYASVFSVLLSPICSALEKRGIGTSTSVVISIGIVVLFVILMFSILLPYLIINTGTLIRKIQPTAESILKYLASSLDQYGIFRFQTNNLQELITRAIPSISSFAARISVAIASSTGQLILSAIFSYYLLLERSVIIRFVQLCFPIALRRMLLQAALGCRNALLSYLSGAVKTSLFISAIMYVGLLLLDIENALFLAFFIGIFEFIPYIGPFIGGIPVVLSAMSNGMKSAGLALILVLTVQQIENTFVSPYFASCSTSVHPFTLLLLVFILGNLFGIWGIILAAPAFVSGRSFLWSLQKNE